MLLRETRRERILDNRNKAILVAQKQKGIIERAKEMEKKAEEEKILKYGCPKKKAEDKFYEVIAKIKKEREAKAAEEKDLEKQFDHH